MNRRAFQMKPLQQYFHMVLFIQYAVLAFNSVDEILWCYHSNETYSCSNTFIWYYLYYLFIYLFILVCSSN